MAKIYTNARYQLRKYATGNSQEDWDTAYNADDADQKDSLLLTRLGSELPPPGTFWRIYRNVIWFSIPADIGTIGAAKIFSKGIYCDNNPTGGFMLDGTSLGGTVADYGDILDLPTVVGTYSAPAVASGTALWVATFNATGLSFLESKADGIAKVAFYSPDQPITPYDRIFVHVQDSPDTILYINELPGFIWVEGTKLAYKDAYGSKRQEEGTATGETGTVAGQLWVEGNYLHYIDASLDERRILGSTTGLSGKTAGQISVNTIQGGTKLCYIDSSGNERCFEGST